MARFHKPPKSNNDTNIALANILIDNNDDIEKFLYEHTERKYYPWHKFQRISKPEKYTHEDLWYAVKILRSRGQVQISFWNEKFSFKIPNFLLEKLHFIDLHLGGNIIMNSIIPKGAEEKFLKNSLIEEAIASSQIEWASTTRRRAKEMLEKNEKPKNNSEQMITNNLIAMRYISAHKNDEITKEKILELHSLLTKNTLENTKDEWVWRYNNEIVVAEKLTNEVLHMPPEHTKIPEYIAELIEFFNNDDTLFIHPIVKWVIIHFFIGWIHPFVDGNGRTARALFYWYILKNWYWLTEFISISRSIKENTEQYKNAYLFTETDENDLTYFIDYNIKCLLSSLDKFTAYIEKKIKEEKYILDIIQDAELTIRQTEIFKFLENNKNNDFTILELTQKIDASRNTIKKDLDFLIEKNLIKIQKRDTKTKSYTYA